MLKIISTHFPATLGKWKEGHLEGFLHDIVVIPRVEENPPQLISPWIRKEQTTFGINCTEPNHLLLMLHIYPHIRSYNNFEERQIHTWIGSRSLMLNILTYVNYYLKSSLKCLHRQKLVSTQQSQCLQNHCKGLSRWANVFQAYHTRAMCTNNRAVWFNTHLNSCWCCWDPWECRTQAVTR